MGRTITNETLRMKLDQAEQTRQAMIANGFSPRIIDAQTRRCQRLSASLDALR